MATNRDLLVGILGEPDFLAGATDTGYLERHDPVRLAPGPAPAGPRPRGDLRLPRRPGDDLVALVDGEPLGERVRAVAVGPDAVALEVDGVRRSYRVHQVTDGDADWSYVDGPERSSALRAVPRFADPDDVAQAGSLLAPMPGSVVRVLVETGATVRSGQPLVVLEAMKMEHTVRAATDGVVSEVDVRPGDQVDTGRVLAVVEEA